MVLPGVNAAEFPRCDPLRRVRSPGLHSRPAHVRRHPAFLPLTHFMHATRLPPPRQRGAPRSVPPPFHACNAPSFHEVHAIYGNHVVDAVNALLSLLALNTLHAFHAFHACNAQEREAPRRDGGRRGGARASPRYSPSIRSSLSGSSKPLLCKCALVGGLPHAAGHPALGVEQEVEGRIVDVEGVVRGKSQSATR